LKAGTASHNRRHEEPEDSNDGNVLFFEGMPHSLPERASNPTGEINSSLYESPHTAVGALIARQGDTTASTTVRPLLFWKNYMTSHGQ
jgi:hypothetical protein